MSCLPDDIMESVISYETSKATWTDLVHGFEGLLDTKENRIMDLKLEYQTFRAKPNESLSQTYTRYKTILNELSNDGVNLSKHEINVGFLNSLPEKWLTFSEGLRNANHTQTLDLADIYERFVYDDNLIQRSQADPKAQKNYKAEYKKLKAKIALLEANPSTSQTPKTLQPKNKCLVIKIFDWDEEEVFDDEEVTQVKVLMALADDELTVGKNHARYGECIDITMKKINILLSMDEDVDWQNYLKYIIIDLNEQIPYQKKKVLDGELFTESSSKINESGNLFVPASMRYDQKMVPKTKDWVERLNPDSKPLNFNTRRILVCESQAVNESLKSTETSNTPESSKDSEAESLTPLILLKNLQGASPSSKVMPLTFQPYSPRERPDLGIMKHTKPKTQDYLDNIVPGTVTPYQYSSSSKQIVKAKAKPFPPCTHYCFNDYIPDDCRNYHECDICGSYDHFTSGHNRVIHIKGGILVESSQSISPLFINHEKYTIVIVDEYSRYTCVHFLRKKSQAPEMIMSFIKMVENQNDIKVKQIRTDIGIEFRNHEDRWSREQHIELVNIIGNPGEGMLTRSMAAKLTAASASECLFVDFLSEIEPKNVSEALKHLGWIDDMQEELNRSYKNKVWTLVSLPYGKIAEAPNGYSRIRKMTMPLRFESSEFPDYVCKLDKALYGLKQTPWSCYETLSTFFIQNKFTRGRINKTFFIYKSKGDVLLVQVYVDDIIFGSTSYKLGKQFEKLMTKKFEISIMGELTYFLGLQIKKDDKGISICQEQ
uniref:Retrovirus-related Pol polyprotein from transposon TNT 1-94 n=1 Tax=Tanacetum cinerariifolium TaxID=118510 RepID=A0A699H3X3_TANCI|nr:retrovirus-related Pol polyprotein from transposon TNT 1-94 [Tanacetum cinerariifolium]